MSRTNEIETRLREAFAPRELMVRDDSESHRGHAGYQEGGESHFTIRIRSADFAGKTRIARHRMVHSALGSELVGAIHALSLDLGE
ncbi:BolA family protein [Marivita sp. GX14005]|uniref:BolA family protein n=1 Tax=Marivita sp. GX14005 TaxID=2942276 RepID=UPI0020188113|nr:BolA family protein [Marivita sp. GX14005]MCL3882430.1 BolA family transcriptional regulator [Marivita sp. GX14005]